MGPWEQEHVLRDPQSQECGTGRCPRPGGVAGGLGKDSDAAPECRARALGAESASARAQGGWSSWWGTGPCRAVLAGRTVLELDGGGAGDRLSAGVGEDVPVSGPVWLARRLGVSWGLGAQV